MNKDSDPDQTGPDFDHLLSLPMQPSIPPGGRRPRRPAGPRSRRGGGKRPTAARARGRPKLSSILIQMAMTVNRGQPVDLDNGSHLYSIDLASAAWNRTLGDDQLFEATLEGIAELDERQPFGPEINARAIVLEAIDKLMRYKRTFHAEDLRTVVSTHPTDSGTLQVLWREEDVLPPEAGKRDSHCEWDVTRPNTISGPEFLPDPSEWPARDRVADVVVARARRRTSVRDRVALLAEATPTIKGLAKEAKGFFGKESPPELGVWYYASNRVTEILSQLPECQELRPLVEFFYATSRTYSVGTKESSDMSRLFYSQWIFLDHPIGPEGENWCRSLQQICQSLEVSNEFTEVVGMLGDSHLRVMRHMGFEDETTVVLKDVVTRERFRVQAWLGSYYRGAKGQLWLVRLWPNLLDPAGPQVAASMPYILEHNDCTPHRAWEQYFQHHLGDAKRTARRQKYVRHMKEGLHPRYWADYINGHFVARDRFVARVQGLPGDFELDPAEAFELT